MCRWGLDSLTASYERSNNPIPVPCCHTVSMLRSPRTVILSQASHGKRAPTTWLNCWIREQPQTATMINIPHALHTYAPGQARPAQRRAVPRDDWHACLSLAAAAAAAAAAVWRPRTWVGVTRRCADWSARRCHCCCCVSVRGRGAKQLSSNHISLSRRSQHTTKSQSVSLRLTLFAQLCRIFNRKYLLAPPRRLCFCRRWFVC